MSKMTYASLPNKRVQPTARAEQVFLNRPLVIAGAPFRKEPRQFAFGQTDAWGLLTVVFTVRGSRLRVISVRPMSRRERRGYGQASSS